MVLSLVSAVSTKALAWGLAGSLVLGAGATGWQYAARARADAARVAAESARDRALLDKERAQLQAQALSTRISEQNAALDTLNKRLKQRQADVTAAQRAAATAATESERRIAELQASPPPATCEGAMNWLADRLEGRK